MQLGKILLEPFGAFSRLLCQFAPGLNVVVGPNEAVKQRWLIPFMRLYLFPKRQAQLTRLEKRHFPLPALSGW